MYLIKKLKTFWKAVKISWKEENFKKFSILISRKFSHQLFFEFLFNCLPDFLKSSFILLVICKIEKIYLHIVFIGKSQKQNLLSLNFQIIRFIPIQNLLIIYISWVFFSILKKCKIIRKFLSSSKCIINKDKIHKRILLCFFFPVLYSNFS